MACDNCSCGDCCREFQDTGTGILYVPRKQGDVALVGDEFDRLRSSLSTVSAERDALRAEVERLRAKGCHCHGCEGHAKEAERLRVKLTDLDYDHRQRVAGLEAALLDAREVLERARPWQRAWAPEAVAQLLWAIDAALEVKP